MPALISNSPLDVLRRTAWEACVEVSEQENLHPDDVWKEAKKGHYAILFEEETRQELADKFVAAFERLKQAEHTAAANAWT